MEWLFSNWQFWIVAVLLLGVLLALWEITALLREMENRQRLTAGTIHDALISRDGKDGYPTAISYLINGIYEMLQKAEQERLEAEFRYTPTASEDNFESPLEDEEADR